MLADIVILQLYGKQTNHVSMAYGMSYVPKLGAALAEIHYKFPPYSVDAFQCNIHS